MNEPIVKTERDQIADLVCQVLHPWEWKNHWSNSWRDCDICGVPNEMSEPYTSEPNGALVGNALYEWFILQEGKSNGTDTA
jgi:hypothetical protein